jgi:hypothetical protein
MGCLCALMKTLFCAHLVAMPSASPAIDIAAKHLHIDLVEGGPELSSAAKVPAVRTWLLLSKLALRRNAASSWKTPVAECRVREPNSLEGNLHKVDKILYVLGLFPVTQLVEP